MHMARYIELYQILLRLSLHCLLPCSLCLEEIYVLDLTDYCYLKVYIYSMYPLCAQQLKNNIDRILCEEENTDWRKHIIPLAFSFWLEHLQVNVDYLTEFTKYYDNRLTIN